MAQMKLLLELPKRCNPNTFVPEVNLIGDVWLSVEVFQDTKGFYWKQDIYDSIEQEYGIEAARIFKELVEEEPQRNRNGANTT